MQCNFHFHCSFAEIAWPLFHIFKHGFKNYKFIYLKSKAAHRDRNFSFMVHSPNAGLVLDEFRSQELNQHIPRGWQRPNYLSLQYLLLSRVHISRKLEWGTEAGLNSGTLIWNVPSIIPTDTPNICPRLGFCRARE